MVKSEKENSSLPKCYADDGRGLSTAIVKSLLVRITFVLHIRTPDGSQSSKGRRLNVWRVKKKDNRCLRLISCERRTAQVIDLTSNKVGLKFVSTCKELRICSESVS